MGINNFFILISLSSLFLSSISRSALPIQYTYIWAHYNWYLESVFASLANSGRVMAEATRFKDLQEAKKKLDQILQTETMKRVAAEEKIHEQMSAIDQKVEHKIRGIDHKCDHLAKLMADIQLQLMNVGKDVGKSDSSILGKDPLHLQSAISAAEKAFVSYPKTRIASSSEVSSNNPICSCRLTMIVFCC
ncbi:uncharacterized protein LOC131011386 isoform X2 [Salvia miltiorrhiza]|uniref:uncharacterized protein LOC131011386 isoform X2 n=1 Tax=Salvia miltiorrhiza TaxID=226208 RepID=UPI0025AD8831|nr:uncharacterized protein LOC131011386 isoform X2 [Salvia miltiorrhiza]